jgi:hypothetical protein
MCEEEETETPWEQTIPANASTYLEVPDNSYVTLISADLRGSSLSGNAVVLDAEISRLRPSGQVVVENTNLCSLGRGQPHAVIELSCTAAECVLLHNRGPDDIVVAGTTGPLDPDPDEGAEAEQREPEPDEPGPPLSPDEIQRRFRELFEKPGSG